MLAVDIVIIVQVARSGGGVSLNYSFGTNTSGAFIRSMDPIAWTGYPGTNLSSQTLHVFPGTNVSEFNLLLNVVNNQSSPTTVCEVVVEQPSADSTLTMYVIPASLPGRLGNTPVELEGPLGKRV